jgi:ubiquinone/menaquinone biosynthesis C-methylase UbiE
MTDEHYIIRGGVEGRERLRLLARVLQPTTGAFFARIGIRAGMRCLDVGCGGGDVTCELARLVGPSGSVVGTDLDETKVGLAREEASSRNLDNVSFRCANLANSEDEGVYDVVYARFLLSHLPDPGAAVAQIFRVLRSGGIVAVEDVDFSGHFCFPESAAFRLYLSLYSEAAKRRGADPNIGPRVSALLNDAGFGEIDLNVIQPVAREGDVKLASALTMESIASAVIDEGLIGQVELDQSIADLYQFARDPGTVMSFPRIVQSWGRRPIA